MSYKKTKINYLKFNFLFKTLFSFPTSKLIFSSSSINYKIKKQIYSKELLIFLSLLDSLTYFKLETPKKDASELELHRFKIYNYFFNSTITTSLKQKVLKKKITKKYTYIRAPYRNKVAQVHITKKQYLISFSFIFFFKNTMTISFIDFLKLFKFFSSNHLTQWSKEIELFSIYRFQ